MSWLAVLVAHLGKIQPGGAGFLFRVWLQLCLGGGEVVSSEGLESVGGCESLSSFLTVCPVEESEFGLFCSLLVSVCVLRLGMKGVFSG